MFPKYEKRNVGTYKGVLQIGETVSVSPICLPFAKRYRDLPISIPPHIIYRAF